MIVGGIVLLGAGLGIGMFIGGDDSSDPSTEISQIIEKKKTQKYLRKNKRRWRSSEECTEEEKDADGNCPVGQKDSKNHSRTRNFATLLWISEIYNKFKRFKKVFTTILGVSTQYDEQVMAMLIAINLLKIRNFNNYVNFSAEDIAGREGKQKLADALKEGINKC